MRVRYRTKDSSTISAQHYSAANGDAVKCTARCCRLCLCVVEPTAANNVIENLLPAADEWTRCERARNSLIAGLVDQGCGGGVCGVRPAATASRGL